MLKHLALQLAERDAQSLRRTRRIAETPCAPLQSVAVDGRANGAATRQLLNFCSNDYLGLANHPTLVEAWADGARRYGAGSGASHLISGHSRAHALLEDDLAELLSPHLPEVRALSFCTGYLANLAVLTALGDADTSIYADVANHASLIDGARLAKATSYTYPHNDIAGLERRLAACTTPRKLIATDGVFSMDGDLARLPELLTLAERHDAYVYVDDAHGFGVLGAQGAGVLAHCGLRSERLIYMGTLGKAAGVAGAFVAAHRTVIEWLVQSARPYIYTTASPPAVAHAARASLRLLQGDEGARLRRQLGERVAALRAGVAALHTSVATSPAGMAASRTGVADVRAGVADLQVGAPVLPSVWSSFWSSVLPSVRAEPVEAVSASATANSTPHGRDPSPPRVTAGAPARWQLAESQTAIQPLIVGSSAAAVAASAALESRGLWVPAIRPPTVPAHAARLRITLSAAHTHAEVARLVEALAAAELATSTVESTAGPPPC